MAYRIAIADGNLTTAGTWGDVDATALLDSEANNTVLTTSYVESSAFTPGAITIDGIAVKVATRAASPSGTISIRLAQAGATVAGTEVTINVSDISSRNGEQGWYLFKFAAPVLLVAATAYTVSAKTSAATQVNLFRNATAGNWSRMLRTTTSTGLAAGDDAHILGEWTAAATVTSRTVTMDSTAATDYGSAVTTLATWTVGKNGTLQFGATAATTYILRLSAIFTIYHGGTLNIGTTGTPMPRDSSARVEFDCGADGDFGLRVFGSSQLQGLSRTSGKNIVQALLNTDEAAAQTVLGVDTDTGWLSGDEIAIASTTQTASQAETRVLANNAGGSSVEVTAGLTNAHSGTSPTQAEVILLTRNVRIESVSSTFMAFVYFGPAASIDADWTAFRYLGTTSTVGKRGVEVDTSTGSLALSYCSFRDFDNNGIFFVAADVDNFTIEHCVGWKVGNQASGHSAIRVSATTGTNWTISNTTIVSGNAGAGNCFEFLSVGGTVTSIRGNSGGGHGMNLNQATGIINKTWSGFELHTNAQAAVMVTEINLGKLSNVNAWRNNSGTAFAGAVWMASSIGFLIIEGGNFFGNNTKHVGNGTANGRRELVLRSITMSGDTSFATTNGVEMNSGSQTAWRLVLENCDLGTVAGIKTAHTNDINIGGAQTRYAEIYLRNTKLASATEIANRVGLLGRSFIAYQRVDQATNVHKIDYPQLGVITYETTVFRTASPSEKMEPAGAGAIFKLESGIKRVPVASGATVNISAYVRKSAAYTGAAPRLMLRANPSLGVDVDTVIDSLSVAADTWEQLSGATAVAEEDGVFEFFVDCDGSAGIVYADDWAAS